MTQYELVIPEQNQEVHTDIEHDIQRQKNGLFTFILRVNNGKVVDYSVVEYANTGKYLELKKVIVQEFTITSHTVVGSKPDAIRPDNR